jgi:integrase/recombinase XerD
MTDMTVVPDRLTREQDLRVIDLWLDGREERTARAYLYELNRFRKHTLKPLPQVTLDDVQAYHRTLSALSSATRARALAVVKSLFTFATKIGYLQFNPAAPVRCEKVNRVLHKRILTPEEVKLLVTAVKRPELRVLTALLYFAGLRVDEAIRLKWVDVVPRPDKGTGQITVRGKGNKHRTLILHPKMWAILSAQPDATDYVFTNEKGHPFDQPCIWLAIREAAQRAGINKPVSAHWFRHSHASHALENGANLNVIQETLGHSSLSITSLYLHARPDTSSSQFVDL